MIVVNTIAADGFVSITPNSSQADNNNLNLNLNMWTPLSLVRLRSMNDFIENHLNIASLAGCVNKQSVSVVLFKRRWNTLHLIHVNREYHRVARRIHGKQWSRYVGEWGVFLTSGRFALSQPNGEGYLASFLRSFYYLPLFSIKKNWINYITFIFDRCHRS